MSSRQHVGDQFVVIQICNRLNDHTHQIRRGTLGILFNECPAAITGLLETFAPRVTGEFRIVLTEKPPLVVPPLKIKIERGADFPEEKLDALEKELLEAFHTRMKISPTIIWQEAGELERSTYKGKKFEKLYEDKV